MLGKPFAGRPYMGVNQAPQVAAVLFSEQSAAQPRQLDFQFPNLALTSAVAAAPIANRIFDQPQAQARQLDFQFPNIAELNFAQLRVKPVGSEVDETVPQPPPHQVDFQFPNIALEAFSQLRVYPVGAAIDEAIPAPLPRQLDFAFPNIVRLVLLDKPLFSPIFERQPPATPPADFPIPNIPALAAAQLQVHPVGGAIDESVPAPQARQTDVQFQSVAQLASKVKPFVNQFFDRPVATQIPIDAPIPNLLTTTLSVAPTKPFSNLLFERAPVPAQPQDNVPPNLLVTILSTPVGIPFLPNISLMTDRPAPQTPSQDQFPVNLTINLPPPAPPVGLHQNPFFITMGRLSQLGNLPS